MPDSLESLQQAFQKGLLGGAAAFDPSQVIGPSSRQSSDERFAIYRNAYRLRLMECLQGEFPALKAAAGDDAFYGFMAAYLHAFPSTHYSLSQLSRHFPQFLAEQRPAQTSQAPDSATCLIELAQLERALSESYDAAGPEAAPLWEPASLLQQPPDELLALRFQPFDCVRLFAFHFPLRDFFLALRRGQAVPVPETRFQYLLITRHDYRIHLTELPDREGQFLQRLLEGATLLDALSQGEPPNPQELQTWFHRWGQLRVWKEAQPVPTQQGNESIPGSPPAAFGGTSAHGTSKVTFGDDEAQAQLRQS